MMGENKEGDGTNQAAPVASIQVSPSRSLTAKSWLQTAAPQTDYYRGKNPKIDTSLWALLFSWCLPAGLTLGIMGIVKGVHGTKNTAAVVWGIVAIILSLALPGLVYWYSSQQSSEITAGTVEMHSDMAVSMKSPEGSQLLNDDQSSILYQIPVKNAEPNYYGVYAVAPSLALPLADELVAILNDDTASDHAYWMYQLFSGLTASDTEITSVQRYNDTVEVIASSEASSFVATVHFFPSEKLLFVQYMSGDITGLSVSLTVAQFFGLTGEDGEAGVWHELSNSFSYNPTYTSSTSLLQGQEK